MFIPTDDGLAACGVAGEMVDATASTGPITDSRSLVTSWNSNNFDGTVNARADYGNCSAGAHAHYVGTQSSGVVDGSEGFGLCKDTFTITSPSVANGQSGTVRFHVTITGGLSETESGDGSVDLVYQIYGSGSATMFRAQATNSGVVPYIGSIDMEGLSGFSTSPGSVSGSGQVHSFVHPLVFGGAFDFNLGLLVATVPGHGIVDSNWQAHITSIEVKDPQGNVLQDFVVTTASGTPYGPGGVAGIGDPRPGADVRLAAFPNPTTGGIRLEFTMPQAAGASLEIHDPAGRLVRRLENGRAGDGTPGSVWWNGQDDRGTFVPGGIYFARLQWNGGSRITRIAIVR
jgi:hypothetical protein